MSRLSLHDVGSWLLRDKRDWLLRFKEVKEEQILCLGLSALVDDSKTKLEYLKVMLELAERMKIQKRDASALHGVCVDFEV